MLRHLFLIAMLALSPITLAAQSDPVMPFGESDPVMNAAIARAQASLPVFLRNAVDATGMSRPGMSVKVAIRNEKGAGATFEHIWVRPFSVGNGPEIFGDLANEPFELGDLHAGDRVYFTADMISDWSYTTETGLRYGNYTTKVIADQLSPADAQALLDSFAPKPLPPGWH